MGAKNSTLAEMISQLERLAQEWDNVLTLRDATLRKLDAAKEELRGTVRDLEGIQAQCDAVRRQHDEILSLVRSVLTRYQQGQVDPGT